ncbi:MAG: hypothetical protein M5U31_15105 [Acidimicrobiia bacterium]|nr:hypothetical protein [Acidimicrobiia bacterium]
MADDGRAVLIARFESAEAAKANSERPEQGEWWAETEKCFDGGVDFVDSEEVDIWLGGGSDDAGFVQIMKGSSNRARAREMDEVMTGKMADFRPDVLGGYRVWTGPETYVEVAYFSSLEEARAGEKKEPPPRWWLRWAASRRHRPTSSTWISLIPGWPDRGCSDLSVPPRP